MNGQFKQHGASWSTTCYHCQLNIDKDCSKFLKEVSKMALELVMLLQGRFPSVIRHKSLRFSVLS